MNDGLCNSQRVIRDSLFWDRDEYREGNVRLAEAHVVIFVDWL